MTAEYPRGDQPLIPMPVLSLPALRQAVAAVAPSRPPEFFQEIQDAFTQAGSPPEKLSRADAVARLRDVRCEFPGPQPGLRDPGSAHHHIAVPGDRARASRTRAHR